MNASLKIVLNYIAPGGGASTINLSAALTYIGSAAGFLDIPAAAADGTSYAVPFGTVAAPKLVAIQNNTNQAVEVSINASEDVFTIGAGDIWCAGGPEATNITSLSVLTTALTTVQGTVAYVVLGDTPAP